ncbi:MAG TPA: DinB family protein [Candidatus Kapabacteria bacterium]|nr:DinB family protein [Candidatus Kapabacteria bacterium]
MTTTTENSAVAPISVIFAFGDSFVLRALGGLSQDELWNPLTSFNNPLLWVAGHIVQTRVMVLEMLGQYFDTGWGKLFDMGAQVGDRKDYPSGTEVARVMREVSPRLQAVLASLEDEQLNKPATLPIPGVKTLADELAFFAMHDAYHIGQLSYIRKGLGHPGIAG